MQEVTIPLHEYLELYKKSLGLEAVMRTVKESSKDDLGFVDASKLIMVAEVFTVGNNKEV